MNNTKQPLIEVRKIKKFFPLKSSSFFNRRPLFIRANEDVSFTINKGETFGIVGESGCGKSTLGRLILQLYPQTSGSALYYGVPLRELCPEYVLKEIRKLPLYQLKAKKSYESSVLLDQKIAALKEVIKNKEANELDQKSRNNLNTLKDKIAKLNEEINYLTNQVHGNIKTAISMLSDEIEDGGNSEGETIALKESVDLINGLLFDLGNFDDVLAKIVYIPKPLEDAKKTNTKIDTINAQKAKLQESIEGFSPAAADKKTLESLITKSKEAKKEASRQLREGSKTAGELILEDNIIEIAKLMEKEELLRRDAQKCSERLILLQNDEDQTLSDELESRKNSLIAEADSIAVEIKSYNRKCPLPITERCLTPEYQTKMENNKEYAINLTRLNKEELRRLRQKLQIIFQDPYSSLDPRMTVGQIIGEAVVEHGLYKKDSPELEEYVIKQMETCGLNHYMIHRYAHQFSGGQRQRIGIARALALQPEFVVCDESVSALDVSIQSQIINLLGDLKKEHNLTYLFISHDLSVIKYISDRIGVMYLGNMVELCESEELYNNPLHPYTKALLSAIPTTDSMDKKRERIILEGDIPSNIFPPSGCKFRTRCPLACETCAKKVPEYKEVEPGHFVACHFYEKTKSL